MRLALVPALAAVLVLTACGSGEAASNLQPDNRPQMNTLRGYNCTQPAFAGRYSCARSVERQARREAAAHAPASCRSCGNPLAH